MSAQMFGQRCRRWATNKPTLDQRAMLAGVTDSDAYRKHLRILKLICIQFQLLSNHAAHKQKSFDHKFGKKLTFLFHRQDTP